MTKDTADQLVAGIKNHRDGQGVQPRVVNRYGQYLVVTTVGTFFEVPDRLPLADNPCRCTARWCASGKLAPGLLDSIRQGGKAA